MVLVEEVMKPVLLRTCIPMRDRRRAERDLSSEERIPELARKYIDTLDDALRLTAMLC